MSPFVKCMQPPLDACDITCGSGPARHPTATHPVTVTPRQQTVTPAYDYTHVQVARPPQRIATDSNSPCEADVLCGRGGSSNRHNVHFRELVAANKATYTTLTKKQKMLFSRKVVDQVHQAGGRFLTKDQSTGLWCDVGLQRSLEKASQALREKTTNNSNNAAAIVADEAGGGMEAATATEMEPSSKPNVNPRTAEAPPLVVPNHLQPIYRPKPAVVTPTYGQDHPGAVAGFPAYYNAPSSYHPSDQFQSMPAPHMGALPFTPRQMSRLKQHQKPLRVGSIPTISNTPPASMVSPMQHTRSWQQPSAYQVRGAYQDPSYFASKSPSERPPSPEYPSSAASCNSMSTGATNSAPEFHQYYPDFKHPRGVISTGANAAAQHPHPRQEHPPEVKRQCTREEEEREQHEEEEVILLDSDHQNTLNNSLQDGSEQLPKDVESKLCLHEKVICSPSDILQGRTSRRGRGEHYYQHDSSMTPTTNKQTTTSKLNTSAEAEGFAGLAALSTAAFLRMDEGE